MPNNEHETESSKIFLAVLIGIVAVGAVALVVAGAYWYFASFTVVVPPVPAVTVTIPEGVILEADSTVTGFGLPGAPASRPASAPSSKAAATGRRSAGAAATKEP